MAIDPDQPVVIREALEAADSVDSRGITVVAAEDAVVLQGSVATFEELSAATAIAERHADAVRSELHVDHNLREGAESGDEPSSTSSRPPAASAYDANNETDDLVADVQDSLDENLSWDPPHEAVEVPTRAESRGLGNRGGAGDDEDDPGLLDEPGGGASLPDASPEELARSAHPRPKEESS